MLIAKSKVKGGWGRVRMSAIRAVWGWWRVAIVAREGDLRGKQKIRVNLPGPSCLDFEKAHLSEPTMKMSLLTAKYLPFPQPMSRPTEPGGRDLRKRSIIGQGCGEGQYLFMLPHMVFPCCNEPYIWLKKSAMRFARILHARAPLRTLYSLRHATSLLLVRRTQEEPQSP